MPHSHHDHSHSHSPHGHSHSPGHVHEPAPVRALAGQPTFSLLRLSALQRLIGSGILLSGLWLLVFLVLSRG